MTSQRSLSHSRHYLQLLKALIYLVTLQIQLPIFLQLLKMIFSQCKTSKNLKLKIVITHFFPQLINSLCSTILLQAVYSLTPIDFHCLNPKKLKTKMNKMDKMINSFNNNHKESKEKWFINTNLN